MRGVQRRTEERPATPSDESSSGGPLPCPGALWTQSMCVLVLPLCVTGVGPCTVWHCPCPWVRECKDLGRRPAAPWQVPRELRGCVGRWEV